MNIREVGEIRRHIRRDRSNMTSLYCCYVNDNKEIISEFRKSTGLMSENEGEKYFALLKRALSGTIGKNLIDIVFKTQQVMDSPEHKLLMELRRTGLEDSELRQEFYQKVIETVSLKQNYLILLGCDSYDVPFRSKNDEDDSGRSEETFRFILCAICPVKQTKSKLHYAPEEKEFSDSGIDNIVSAPELGFLFPAFDDRATNIYGALYYTHSPKNSHEEFVERVFHTPIPKPAFEQKRSFEAILANALDEQCSLEVVQSIHEDLAGRIELHKQSRVADPLLVCKEDVTQVLSSCGVSDSKIAKFSIDYDETFGHEADLHPKNIINEKRIEVTTPDVSIKVAPDRADLIETRVIDGVKYILINAEESVEVNGVSIHIRDEEKATV
ncbi:MAG: DUF4317 domain-containing protein [Ruminococcaceae bacterium]|nr:DUF4317 domain-containing protein [Oscillospiraceae bacterium]